MFCLRNIIILSFIIVVATITILTITVFIPNNKINKARQLLENGQYEQALEILEKIHNEDSRILLSRVDIYMLLNSGAYYVAKEMFVFSKQGEVVINYDLNGGEMDLESDYIGDFHYSYKEGYSFIDYKLTKYELKDKELVLYLKSMYAPLQYNISYDLDGGVNNENNPINYTIESDDIIILPPYKEGYKFIGWDDGENEDILEYVIPKGSIGNISLKAKWEVAEYKVNFDANGGSAIYDELLIKYNSYARLPIPTKKGYEFLGWEYNGEIIGTGLWTIGSDCTLVAKWEQLVFKIILRDYEGAEIEKTTIEVKYGEEYTLPVLTKPNYQFLGWFNLYNNNEQVFDGVFDYSTNIYLSAKWSGNLYYITFYPNGGTLVGADKKEVEYGKQYTLPTPIKDGYYFDGWYYNDIKLTGSNYNIPSDIKAEAKWIVQENKIVYNLDGGINDPRNKETYETSDQKIQLYSPSKVGYSFMGWVDEGREVPAWIEYIEPNTSGYIFLTAKWEMRRYKITFSYENELTYRRFYYGEDIIYTNVFKKEGYYIDHWVDKDNQIFALTKYTLDDDITLYPVWKEKSYSIEYDLDGGVLPDDYIKTITYNKEYTLPILTKQNYRFGGWYYNDEIIEDGIWNIDLEDSDIIKLKALWLADNQYRIYYDLQGGENLYENPYYYTSGKETTIKRSYKFGITFTGWLVNSDTTPIINYVITPDITGDIYLKATWKHVTVIFDVNGGDEIENPIVSSEQRTYYPAPKVFRKGYTFLGWFNSSDEEYDNYLRKDETYIAKWIANKYTITFDVNGGDQLDIEKLEIRYDENCILPIPTRKGYIFSGWYYNDEKIENGAWQITLNITLVAKWEETDLVEYKVYHYYETLESENYVLKYQETYYIKPNTKVTGEIKTDEGYILPQLKTVTVNIDSSTIIEYFYARKQYTINFQTNSDNTLDPLTFKYEEELILPTPFKEGYIFIGWYEDESLTILHTSNTMRSSNYTLYAKYEKKIE